MKSHCGSEYDTAFFLFIFFLVGVCAEKFFDCVMPVLCGLLAGMRGDVLEAVKERRVRAESVGECMKQNEIVMIWL